MPKTAKPMFGAALLALGVVLAGCTSTQPQPESSSVSVPPSPEGVSVVAVPPVLDQSSVAGLIPLTKTSDNPNDNRAIGTVSVPGSPSLAASLTAIVDQQVARYEKGLGDDSGSELNISWAPVLAAGPIIGVRITTDTYFGGAAHGATTSQSVYNDVTAGHSWDGSDLVAEPDRLAELVGQAAEAASLGAGTPSDEAVLLDLRFGSDGSLTTVVAQGEAAAESEGELAVRLDSSVASTVLSADGKAVQAAAVAAEPFAGIPDAPTPTPQESTVPTVSGTPQPEGEDVDCSKLKCIAITYDDGPGPYTQKLLDVLKEKDVKTTFFLVGQNVATQPELVKAELAAGHVIGNHTWRHPDLTRMSESEVADQIDRTAHAIQKAAGITTNLLRPPYGATNDTVAAVAKERGLSQILWNVDTEDWKNLNVAMTTKRALDGARAGAIILMHDIHPTTVEAAPGIIDALRSRGYTLVTVPQLLGGQLEPGKKYFNAPS